MARVLWIGDAGCHTGFGTVTHAIGERLVEKYDHDVHVLATNYRGDHWPTSLKLYVPNLVTPNDVYGQARFLELLGKVNPDVVVILNDPYVTLKFLYRNHWDEEKILLQYRPIISYLPVDGINQPPVWKLLEKVTTPVVMSEWGKTLFPDATLAYHGIDAQRFRPATDAEPMRSSGGHEVRNKRDAKVALGYDPDAFLVVRVDRNSRRKDFSSTWKALVPVMKRHSDIVAHFHCQWQGDDGVELGELNSREPDLQGRFRAPGNHNTRLGWSPVDLAILYNAADVFVSTSWGEGFGLTLAESLASGTPVIAQDCSAITEVVGPGGILIPPKGLISVVSGEDQWLPDIDAFTDAIEHLYQSRGARRSLGQKGIEHVRSKFSWDVAAETFDRLITDLASSPEVTPEGTDHGLQDLHGSPEGVPVA